MSKVRCVLGIIMASAMMSACGGNGETNNPEAVEFEAIDEKDTSPSKEVQLSRTVSSLTEYLQNIDTDFLENEKSYIGTPAVKRYEEFLSDKSNWPDPEYKSIHIALGMIDDDSIPELFVALDTVSIYGVHVYKYDPDTDSVIYLGEFSQYGYCWYAGKKNRISGQYGNNGLFEVYYYEIADNKVKVVGRLLSDGFSEVIKYYADYAEETEISAAQTHLESVSRPDDSFCISEEEFELREEAYMLSPEPIKIGYDNMTEMILPNE